MCYLPMFSDLSLKCLPSFPDVGGGGGGATKIQSSVKG